MDDISTLQIRVLSADVATATARLNALERQSLRAETATGGMMGNFIKGAKGIAVATTAFLTASAAARGFMDVISRVRNYQVLQAGLKTATGSLENATVAFTRLRKMAADTPYTINEVTKAFISLVNYGLNPSERALKAYGNISAGMTKELGQLIEAVADASVGEFTRIKESFGIVGKNLGDTVAFTFRGITTEVENNKKAIEDYFISLGEGAFGGAMEERMKTLDGAISNLGDAWDTMLVNLGNTSGVAGGAEEAIRGITASIQELDESGDLAEWLNRAASAGVLLGNTFSAAFNLIEAAFSKLGGIALEATSYLTTLFGTTAPGAINAFLAASEVGVTGLRGMFVDFATGSANAIVAAMNLSIAAIEKLVNYATASLNGVITSLNSIAGTSYGTIGSIALPKIGGFSNAPASEFVDPTTFGRVGTFGEDFAAATGDLSKYYNRNATNQLQNAGTNIRQATLAGSALFSANGAMLPGKGSVRDSDLSEFGLGGDGSSPGGSKSGKKSGSGGGGGGGGADSGLREFEQLQDRLLREETAIDESYAKRLEIINKYTQAGSKAQADLTLALVDEWEAAQQQQIDKSKSSLDTMWEAFEQEEQLIKDSYEKRKQIILEATAITEEQRAALMQEAQEKYSRSLQENAQETNSKYLDAASEFFGNLSSMGSAFGEKGFKIAKAAAIAQATIKTYESATSAYASLAGIPYVGPALGAAAAAAAIAAGVANIATISAQQYQAPSAGSFAGGGIVGGSSPSGDRLTANVNSGEMILNQSQQRNLFAVANGGGGSQPAQINIFNQAPGVSVEARESRGKDDQKRYEIFIRQASGDVRRGIGPLAKAIEETYPSVRR